MSTTIDKYPGPKPHRNSDDMKVSNSKIHAIISINSLTVSPIPSHSINIHKTGTTLISSRHNDHNNLHTSHAYNYYNNHNVSNIHNRIKWTVSGLDGDEDDDENDDGQQKRKRTQSIKYAYSDSDEDSFKLLNDSDDDKQVEENSYYQNRRHRDSNTTTVTFIDDDDEDEDDDDDDDDEYSQSIVSTHDQEEKEIIDPMHDNDDGNNNNNNYNREYKGNENDNELSTISTIYNLRPFEFGILLSQQFEAQMRRYRLVTLLKISEFKLHIFPEGLLKDIINVIVEFELGMNDIQQFTIDILENEIKPGISSYIAYCLGCFESLCMFCVIVVHASNWYRSNPTKEATKIATSAPNAPTLNSDIEYDESPFIEFQLMILMWVICLLIHIFGGVILWRRGHGIASRLRELKIAMRVSNMRNKQQEEDLNNNLHLTYNNNNNGNHHHHTYSETDDDEDEEEEEEEEDLFEDIHVGEAFARLERWCNLSEIRLNNKFNSIKILMLVLQKYILPLSISLCILIDPSGNKWYAYISILAYYLHLHILYEIFHNERHAMVAFARVTLFWGIFISIVAVIASATSTKSSDGNKHNSSSSSSSEANFLAGLAGALLFGIFIAVFDVCWFFSDNPAKKRLIFFVILVNFCYIGGLLYMFGKSLKSIIIITLFFTISLIHCQIVFNQIIDCVLYGDLDGYLDLPIPNKFFINSYYQTFVGMTNSNNVQILNNDHHYL